MFPVCSAVFSGTHHPQIYVYGGLRTPGLGRGLIEEKCILEDRVNFGNLKETYPCNVFSKVHATSFYSSYSERYDQSTFKEDCMNLIGNDGLGDTDIVLYPDQESCLSYSSGGAHSLQLENNHALSFDNVYSVFDSFDENADSSLPRPDVVPSDTGKDLMNELTSGMTSGQVDLHPDSGSALMHGLTKQEPETFSTIDLQSDGATRPEPSMFISIPAPDGERPPITNATLEDLNDVLHNFNKNIEVFSSGITKSIDTSINSVNNALQSAYDEITSSFNNAIQRVTDPLVSSVDKTGQGTSSAMTKFSDGLRETAFNSGVLAVNALRKGIVVVEESLGNVGNFLYGSYGSVKNSLPSDTQTALTSSEDTVKQSLSPIGAAFQEVYLAIEALERGLGLDPSDPIIPFLLFVGSTLIVGFTYREFIYGGYSGVLSPKLALEQLTQDKRSVLIDVRPEDLRETDGIPDLRQRARFKYASLDLPKTDDSLRKLLRKDVDELLLATVIRNLKIVNDSSNVIIMDADGSQSKSIARSLRKVGIKKTYLLQGGFASWKSDDLRVKELKPETALTILNEETEAILEAINPTPEKVFIAGLGLVAATYAIIEWEKTLQLIGIIGLGQTLYRRVSSYQDSEDLNEDVRLLLAPVRLGAQAIAWGMTKLEPNKIGLRTAPSTTAVQNRVLQAAAKHGTLPLELEDVQDTAQGESVAAASLGENLDLTEA